MDIADNNPKLRAVLEYVEMRANATMAEIARETGFKEHVVRRVVDSLLERKLIHRYVHLNVYPLGFFEVDLFVSLRDLSRKSVEGVISWCIMREEVCFLAETIGRYDLKIGLTVRDSMQVQKFIEDACQELDFPFSQKSIVTVMELFDFGVHKGSDLRGASLAALRFGFGGESYDLNLEDHKILMGLARHPDLSLSTMARRIGLSSSTLAYRVQKLEKAGVIGGYRYLFDPLGKATEYFHATLALGGVSPEVRKKVGNFCAAHPQIPFFAETSGDFDFLICMAVKRSVETVPIVRSVQAELAPYVHAIGVEVYASPALRKLVKYPFSSLQSALACTSRKRSSRR